MTTRLSSNLRKGFALLAMVAVLQPFSLHGVLKRHLSRVHPETALAAKPKKAPRKAKKTRHAKRAQASGGAGKVTLAVAGVLSFLGLTYAAEQLLQTPKGLPPMPVNGYAAPQGAYPEALAGRSDLGPGDASIQASGHRGVPRGNASSGSRGSHPVFPCGGKPSGRTNPVDPNLRRKGQGVNALVQTDPTDPETQPWVADWEHKAQWLLWQQEDLSREMNAFEKKHGLSH